MTGTDLTDQISNDVRSVDISTGPVGVRHPNHFAILTLLLALAASLISLWYFYSHGWANICGDGISRLNGTRKLLDWEYPDLWSRYFQIGTQWLPLPYFVMTPFFVVDLYITTGLSSLIDLV